jgi:ethanolamine ammonia-lyase small subunit
MSDFSNKDEATIAKPNDVLDLRGLTAARVALERTGVSVITRHALEFSLAHAQARDAVHATLAVASLMAALRERDLMAVAVRSAASNRTEYLRRPDLGRTLAGSSAEALGASDRKGGRQGAVISVILADGLSALAVERHALPVLDALLPLLRPNTVSAKAEAAWVLAPVVVAEQARVALGDEIGVALEADVTVMLIGERPGLSSPASLGAYITWAPRPGRTDAERNCVSNIHTDGLGCADAARKIAWFIMEGRRLGRTGVELRDSSVTSPRALAD